MKERKILQPLPTRMRSPKFLKKKVIRRIQTCCGEFPSSCELCPYLEPNCIVEDRDLVLRRRF